MAAESRLPRQRINRSPYPLDGDLVDHVTLRMAAIQTDFDADAFEQGLYACLDRGDFVFVYVARNLDSRTRAVMTYLAEGPRMTFFAVEVDYFTSGTTGDAVMVPRTAFVPSWLVSSTGGSGRVPTSVTLSALFAAADAPVRDVARLLADAAPSLHLHVDDSKKARQFRPRPGEGRPQRLSRSGARLLESRHISLAWPSRYRESIPGQDQRGRWISCGTGLAGTALQRFRSQVARRTENPSR